MGSASYVFFLRMVFSYFVTRDWIFEISFCDNSIQFNSTRRILSKKIPTHLRILSTLESRRKNVKMLRIIDSKDKTSSRHLIRFPNGSARDSGKDVCCRRYCSIYFLRRSS